MNVTSLLNWVAVFVAFLGPILLYPSVEVLTLFMFLIGSVVAIVTYNSGFNMEPVKILLLSAIVLAVTPPFSTLSSVVSYLQSVIMLSAWYVVPIAIVHGWKQLVG